MYLAYSLLGDETRRERETHYAMDRMVITAAYVLRGDFDPDEVTGYVSMEPDARWKRGKPAGLGKHESSGWKLRSSSDLPPIREPDREWEPHTQSALAQLQPGWPHFIEFGRRFRAHIECTLEVQTHWDPRIVVPRNSVEAANSLNAPLVFNVYYRLPREQT